MKSDKLQTRISGRYFKKHYQFLPFGFIHPVWVPYFPQYATML